MSVKKILKTIKNEFVYGGHLQSFGMAGIFFTSAFLSQIKITIDGLLVAYLLFYPIYLYNRLKEIKIDQPTNVQRTEHLQKYLSIIPLILIFSVLCLIFLLIYFSNFRTLALAFFILLFGLLYTDVFKMFTNKIALFKNLYVAIFFSVMAIFPAVYYSTPFSINLAAFSVLVFINAIIMQIFLDLKDLETDKKLGLLTFPVIFGEEKTLRFLRIMNLAVIGPFLLVFSLFFDIFPRSILALLLTIPINFYVYEQERKKNHLNFILIGGKFIIWPILILIGEAIL